MNQIGSFHLVSKPHSNSGLWLRFFKYYLLLFSDTFIISKFLLQPDCPRWFQRTPTTIQYPIHPPRLGPSNPGDPNIIGFIIWSLSHSLSLAQFLSSLVFQPWTYPTSVWILHHRTIVTVIHTCALSWGCVTMGFFLSLSYFRHFPGVALALWHVFILIFFNPIELLLWSFLGH